MANSFYSLSRDASILQRIKEAYLIWINIQPHIQKSARFTIGTRIENKLLDLLEIGYRAYFSPREEKIEKISKCIFLLDTLKFIIAAAWEAKLISHRHMEEIGTKLEEIGRMLGGWRNSILNPQKKPRFFLTAEKNDFRKRNTKGL